MIQSLIKISILIIISSLLIVACNKKDSYLINFGKSDPTIVIDDFSTSKLGGLPFGWEIRDPLGKKVYSIKEENGDQYLHAYDTINSVLILKKVSWDINTYPKLKWRWKAIALPKGGNERHGATNDSAAAVYVLFKNKWYIPIPKYIKYVWSTTLPHGDVFLYKLFRGVIVLESGDTKLNQWLIETVDVAADYRKIYGEEPSRIVGIGIITDANATHSSAEAHYDDFEIVK
jgi:hypothetical protein